MSEKIHIIFGATASGKTEFSVNLAKEIGNAEIINADSMQIYQEIPIITNQPKEAEKQNIPHHLFGVKSILHHSDLSEWLEMAVPLIHEIKARTKTPILVGGTGLYLKSIVEGVSEIPKIPPEIKQKFLNLCSIVPENKKQTQLYDILKNIDPEGADKIKPNDTQRTLRALEVKDYTGVSISEWNKKPQKKFFDKENFSIHFIDKPREEIYLKINARFENMVENGLLDEAKKVREIWLENNISASNNNLPAYKAHGLREIIAYLDGEISLDEAISKAQQATRNYAKRQFTWWRGWQGSFFFN
ncbi:MAG: tRNA (adenosine(37)-N6)-dimethylallyltransferase MiaA [Rickettsiales bacterium]|nr:tRNA (adenosine(37)-N6)-dimethylallyltransferase MiaA [Rickettsiales bacterium]